MRRKKFGIEKHTRIDKSFKILSPTGIEIELSVNFDDVNHSQVNIEAKAIVKLLNENLDKILI